ncbi:uroporphyrinogen-III synthase [Agrobacterium sp. ES01]|uniref:uroporphyrinogen-III synthase n=1 Tax=Agrobacterium sp. ES01 TaxID=3420714 RepID=UPI003D146996
MRVLVTRAEPAASKTAARLRDMGHSPLVMPLAQAVRDAEAAQYALSATPSAIAATSAEAMRTVADIRSPETSWKQTTVFAVGEATAEAARNAGFQTVLMSGGNGRALADFIHARRANSGAPVLYLAGEPRSEGFEARMTELHAPVETCICYRMIPVEPSQDIQRKFLSDTPPDVILLYSIESVRRLLALPLLKDNLGLLKTTRFHCLSQKVADALPEQYAANTVICDVPDESSLLGTL